VHVIIAGCGRVGAHLAGALYRQGHDVAVIDKDPMAFRRLDDTFAGNTVTGIVFDAATMEQAGIRHALAFVAVTSGDNSNIVSARVARERYGVERVVARIYDPERAAIFKRLGITTIASALWTADEVMRALAPAEERIEMALGTGNGEVVVLSLPLPGSAHNVAADELHRPGEFVLAAVTRAGRTSVPVKDALLEGGDLLHLSVQRESLDRLRDLVNQLGGER
jgi:trk system potassium uptake protein